MFDLGGLQAAVARHGRVARVVVAAVQGSAPREVGASMLVWDGGQSGTIGGGALEWQAVGRAREVLAVGGRRLDREALGPGLGQCCGGVVTLLTEVYGAAELVGLAGLQMVARPVAAAGEMPLAVARLLARARQGAVPVSVLMQGWMVEPVASVGREVWVWGAGHVGRAVVSVLAPLPGVAITWVDVDVARFPEVVPEGVTVLAAADPGDLVARAPATAEHLVLTFSHALDLELCHRLLRHGFASLGLIGSASKARRFASRLQTLGHSQASIARIACPIGDPGLGKHPQAIALGVAVAFVKAGKAGATGREIAV
ncbi:xanthine dehydrogenase accessory protein XdhC [Rhodobacter ferrooxidans]|uniref:Xanthine dehydrogenase accessory protein XdhC n=1 Tax=Rhodobacter ferrooxidans TaxID=371731 RepID=C8S2H3_9RHOB|nr:xanthine dehydrogenase accessory protein XdhC [Rhodobacter sp. SW2]EEW24844.1 xanthine dehydrogenase accessory protein XdhC [Rhodobacter sp. SW2]